MRAIIDNKEVEVLEVKEYEYDNNKLEVFFMYNGVTKAGAIINKSDLIIDSTLEVITNDLVKSIKDNFNIDADVDRFDESNNIVVEGTNYIIYITVFDNGFTCATLNKSKCNEYDSDEYIYKNEVERKSIKGVINYIKKYK